MALAILRAFRWFRTEEVAMSSNLLRAALGYTGSVKSVCCLLLALGACGAPPLSAVTPGALQPVCEAPLQWSGRTCVDESKASAAVGAASEALAAFDVDAALAQLEDARARGPYGHALLIKLYEQLGIAYSYLKKEKEALDAFGMLLALDPGHLLSYTLSPQATFLYERARKANDKKAPAQVDVSWPQGLREDEPIPLSVEVVANPLSMLHSMAIYVRNDKREKFRRLQIPLPEKGAVSRVVLPAANTKRQSVLELYGSVYDKEGNEVLLWFDATRPREVPLGYQAPSPWYRKWWVWAAIGGSTALATGATVYFLSIGPPDTVSGGFSLGG